MTPRGPTDPATRFPRRSTTALWREVDGCAVLFHEETGRAFALNGTATRLWAACDGRRSIADIASALAGSCNVDRGDVLGSARELFSDLVAAGFAEMTSVPGDAGDDVPREPDLEGWEEPRAEEIVFAACDCGGGIGVVRNSQCTLLGLLQTTVSGF